MARNRTAQPMADADLEVVCARMARRLRVIAAIGTENEPSIDGRLWNAIDALQCVATLARERIIDAELAAVGRRRGGGGGEDDDLRYGWNGWHVWHSRIATTVPGED